MRWHMWKHFGNYQVVQKYKINTIHRRYTREYTIVFLFCFKRERERERAGEGAEGEGERASYAVSMPSTEPNVGPDFTTPRP